MSKKELVLGAGNNRKKALWQPGETNEYSDPFFVDIDPDCKPDLLLDLNRNVLPFSENSFDEIHMYEVLEHLGTQGDYKHFFRFFSEVARVLKPNGLFFASVPAMDSRWVWGDPGHTRCFPPEYLVFLNQKNYEAEVGKTPMTDYRSIYKASLEPVFLDTKNGRFFFVLKNVKNG